MAIGLKSFQELNDILLGKTLQYINKTADSQFLTFVVDGDNGIPHTFGFCVEGSETSRISAVINITYGLGYKICDIRFVRFDGTCKVMLIMSGGEIVTVEVKCDENDRTPLLRFVAGDSYPDSALFIKPVNKDYEEPWICEDAA